MNLLIREDMFIGIRGKQFMKSKLLFFLVLTEFVMSLFTESFALRSGGLENITGTTTRSMGTGYAFA